MLVPRIMLCEFTPSKPDIQHENEAEESWLFSFVFVFKIISTFISQNPKFFFMHVFEKDALLLYNHNP